MSMLKFRNSVFRVIKKYLVKKGANFSATASKLVADLTADMLARYNQLCNDRGKQGNYPGASSGNKSQACVPGPNRRNN